MNLILSLDCDFCYELFGSFLKLFFKLLENTLWTAYQVSLSQ